LGRKVVEGRLKIPVPVNSTKGIRNLAIHSLSSGGPLGWANLSSKGTYSPSSLAREVS